MRKHAYLHNNESDKREREKGREREREKKRANFLFLKTKKERHIKRNSTCSLFLSSYLNTTLPMFDKALQNGSTNNVPAAEGSSESNRSAT